MDIQDDVLLSCLVSVLVRVDELDPEDHDDQDHDREAQGQHQTVAEGKNIEMN